MAHMRKLINAWRCRRLIARLVEFADGTLATPQQRRVEQHVAACTRCAEALAALREVPKAVRAATIDRGDAVWDGQRREIMRTVRQLPETAPHRRLTPAFDWRLALPVVTAVLIAVAGYWSLWHPAQPTLNLARYLDAMEAEDVTLLAEVAESLVPTTELSLAEQFADGGVVGSMAEDDWIEESFAVPLDPHDLNDVELETLNGLIG